MSSSFNKQAFKVENKQEGLTKVLLLFQNLYTMLINMLAERGVDSGFAQQLLDYSTALEHHYYIKFLENLENFIKQN